MDSIEEEIIAEFDMDIHVLSGSDVKRGVRVVVWEGQPGCHWLCITAVGMTRDEADRMQSGLREDIERRAKQGCEESSRDRLPSGHTLTNLLLYKTERAALKAGRLMLRELGWVGESLGAVRQ